MHISTLYCSTYSPNQPITGHMDVQAEAGLIRINFTPAECEQIQNIAVGAYERQSAKIAEEITSSTPALVALPPPNFVEGEEAEFSEMPF